MAEGDVISNFSSPGIESTGITVATGTIIIADPSQNAIDVVLPTGTIIGSIPKPESKIRGITWDGSNLWVVISSSKILYEIDFFGNIISSFSIPILNPHGVTWDGINLWLTDPDNPTIYKMTKLGVLLSIITGNNNQEDLTYDGTNLRVTASNTIQEITQSGTLVSSFTTPEINPSGLGFDGNNLWSGNINPSNPIIYELELDIIVNSIVKSISSDACINNKITNNSCINTKIQKDVCINTRIQKDVCL